MNLSNFRVKNFRGFIDTGSVSLRPINILVGKNSIGKSSFARLWPLFNQGIGLRKRSPIMWDGGQVDFGSFKDALSRYSKDECISFEFMFAVEQREFSDPFLSYLNFNKVRFLSDGNVVAQLDIGLSDVDGYGTVCNKLSLDFFGVKINYFFKKNGDFSSMAVNGEDVKIPSFYVITTGVDFFFPIIDYSAKTSEKGVVPAYSVAYMALWLFLRQNLHGKISDGRIHDLVGDLSVVGEMGDIINFCDGLPYEYKSWKEFLVRLSDDLPFSQKFQRLLFLAAADNLIRDIDVELKKYFQGVSYIQPLRAIAKRDYRKQELAVGNIDSRGENLPFFLESLSRVRMESLNAWLSETLQIKVILSKESRNVIIKIEDMVANRTDNMTDMGFGFSQVLPLAVQAWISCAPSPSQQKKTTVRNILVWEQPELHLHPAMQRMLARLIVKTVSLGKERGLSFVIETHSQSIINEIGDLVVSGDIAAEDVQIFLFQLAKNNDGNTEISTTGFTQDGELLEWPYGFLAV